MTTAMKAARRSAWRRCDWCSPSFRRPRRRAATTSWPCCAASASAGSRPRAVPRRRPRRAGHQRGVRGRADRGLPPGRAVRRRARRDRRAAVAETGASSPRDMGRVMKAVMAGRRSRRRQRRLARSGGPARPSRERPGAQDDRARQRGRRRAGRHRGRASCARSRAHLDCDVFLRGNVLTLDGDERGRRRPARSSASSPS